MAMRNSDLILLYAMFALRALNIQFPQNFPSIYFYLLDTLFFKYFVILTYMIQNVLCTKHCLLYMRIGLKLVDHGAHIG